MKITTKCGICQKTSEVEVPDAEYRAWRNGELIQNALVSVPAPVREQLITGIDGCWDELFAKGE
jgi:hypothetical protein